jgi:aminoglycoside phosphotransferase (APT) family kinase protein
VSEEAFLQQAYRDIASNLGFKVAGLRFLASGASSQVYKLKTDDGDLVLRLSHDSNANYQVDAAIRRQLVGQPVAEPIATGALATANDSSNLAWSLDRLVRDVHPTAGNVPERACMELGAFLAQLQALPTQGFGLLQNDPDLLRGRADHLRDGLRTRLVFLWPDDDLAAHAGLDRLMPYIKALEQLQTTAALALAGPMVLCHSDLHAQQLLIWRKQLSAVLDFGDAAIGPVAWDIASFAYFHGWQQTDLVLHGYSDSHGQSHQLKRQAQYFVVVLALHQLQRGVLQAQEQRIAGALLALEATVPLLLRPLN